MQDPMDIGGGLSPMQELEMADLQVELASLDEEATMFDPDEHPKVPNASEEGVTSRDGSRPVDMMDDTPAIEQILDFDLTMDDLDAVDLG